MVAETATNRIFERSPWWIVFIREMTASRIAPLESSPMWWHSSISTRPTELATTLSCSSLHFLVVECHFSATRPDDAGGLVHEYDDIDIVWLLEMVAGDGG